MKHNLSLILFSPLFFLLVGCGDKASEELMAEVNAKLNQQLDLVDKKNELIKDRMSVLENENREMREQLDRILSNQENPADLTNQVASILELQVEDLITEQLEGRVDSTASATAVTPELIESQIAAYEAKKEAKAEAEREQRRAEEEAAREQRRQERLVEVQTELNLNDQQVQQLQVAQDTMRKGFTDLFTQMREGNLSREERGQSFQGLREAHETIVKGFLSEDQATAYLKDYARGFMFDGGRGFGGRGFGGRGGRGPGGR